jgi:hypothetical protein
VKNSVGVVVDPNKIYGAGKTLKDHLSPTL